MMENPFKPKDVKMFNYHPEHMERNKISNIVDHMNDARNTKFQPKTFKDAVKLPKSYGDVMEKPKGYSDGIKKPDNSYSSHLPSAPRYGDINGFKGN